jgi:hypothetical protein
MKKLVLRFLWGVLTQVVGTVLAYLAIRSMNL